LGKYWYEVRQRAPWGAEKIAGKILHQTEGGLMVIPTEGRTSPTIGESDRDKSCTVPSIDLTSTPHPNSLNRSAGRGGNMQKPARPKQRVWLSTSKSSRKEQQGEQPPAIVEELSTDPAFVPRKQTHPSPNAGRELKRGKLKKGLFNPTMSQKSDNVGRFSRAAVWQGRLRSGKGVCKKTSFCRDPRPGGLLLKDSIIQIPTWVVR